MLEKKNQWIEVDLDPKQSVAQQQKVKAINAICNQFSIWYWYESEAELKQERITWRNYERRNWNRLEALVQVHMGTSRSKEIIYFYVL